MVIQDIALLSKNKYVSLTAKVAFKGGKPERMYFSTDLKNQSLISADYSPFLAAILLPCMKTREDIHIDGPVSKKLLQNTETVMSVVESWDIGLKKIKIVISNTDRHSGEQSDSRISNENIQRDAGQASMTDKLRTGVFFSAGVDSFYTYLKNKKQITDLIFVHGFDIPLDNQLLFNKVKDINSKIATEERVNLITVKTNVADIVEKKLVWDFAHGGALASVALFLGKGLEKVLISGAVRGDMLFPYGTHPYLDKYWSTEKTKIEHFGTEHNRLEKIMHTVSKSSLALKYLHVCTQNIKGKYNCSKCYKCLMTMIELSCARALNKQQAFDKKINVDAVRNMYYDYSLLYNVQGEANLAELKRQNRYPEMQDAINESLIKSKRPSQFKKLSKLFASFDQKYNDRRFYRMIFKINKNQDRNALFKFLLQKGVFK